MFIIEISYNFLYVWNCMELFDKKLPIYDNCMTSVSGQPGCCRQISHLVTSRPTSRDKLEQQGLIFNAFFPFCFWGMRLVTIAINFLLNLGGMIDNPVRRFIFIWKTFGFLQILFKIWTLYPISSLYAKDFISFLSVPFESQIKICIDK